MLLTATTNLLGSHANRRTRRRFLPNLCSVTLESGPSFFPSTEHQSVVFTRRKKFRMLESLMEGSISVNLDRATADSAA